LTTLYLVGGKNTDTTIRNLAQTTTSILTMVNSHLDGWKTNTSQTQ
jgi:hypothetical protein